MTAHGSACRSRAMTAALIVGGPSRTAKGSTRIPFVTRLSKERLRSLRSPRRPSKGRAKEHLPVHKRQGAARVTRRLAAPLQTEFVRCSLSSLLTPMQSRGEIAQKNKYFRVSAISIRVTDDNQDEFRLVPRVLLTELFLAGRCSFMSMKKFLKPSVEVPPILVCPLEAARLLSISPRTLWTLTNEGKIPSLKISKKCVRYRRADLDAWTQQQIEVNANEKVN
jgi:excisionase family DNA binding protein